jgi:hypothetical protein
MMHVGFVTPAYGRFPVTRLALAQRRLLVDDLAVRGVTADCVIVADDDNLDVAREFGFETLERPNVLGLKVNDGIEFVCERGADWVCFAGSDNWLHPDLFPPLKRRDVPAAVMSGTSLAVVDLERQRMLNVLTSRTARRPRYGAPPWLIPRALLEPCTFRPVPDDRRSGMEMLMVLGMGSPAFVFDDPSPYARVDFKSSESMTSFAAFEHLASSVDLDPWATLEGWYPAELVEMARETSDSMRMVGAYA